MTPGSMTPRSSRVTGNSVYPPGMNFGFSDQDLFLPEPPRGPRRPLPRAALAGAPAACGALRAVPGARVRSLRRSSRPSSSRPAGRSRRSSRSCSAFPPSATPRGRVPGRSGPLQVPVLGLPEAHREEVPRCRVDRLPRLWPPPRRAEALSSTFSRPASTPRTRSAASPGRDGTSSTSRAPSRRPVRATRRTRPRPRASAVADLRARAAGTPLPLPGDDAALVKEWAEAFDGYVALLRFAAEHRARTKPWASFVIAKADEVRRARRDGTLPAGSSRGALRPAVARAPARRLHADGPRARPPRQVTGEVHYCILCHEREKDSCATGFHAEGREHSRERARGAARRLPARREDLGDAHAAARGRLPRRARARLHRQSDGSRHRATASATTA